MTPEPQRLLTASEEIALGMWYSQHPPVYSLDRVGSVDTTAEAVALMRDHCRLAQARAIAQDAEAHEILCVTNLPIYNTKNALLQCAADRRLKQMVRAAMGRTSDTQHDQLLAWQRSDGAMRDNSLGFVALWHLPLAKVHLFTDQQIEELSQAWLMPLISQAISIPRYCFSHTLASWVVAEDEVNQGISIALLRED